MKNTHCRIVNVKPKGKVRLMEVTRPINNHAMDRCREAMVMLETGEFTSIGVILSGPRGLRARGHSLFSPVDIPCLNMEIDSLKKDIIQESDNSI